MSGKITRQELVEELNNELDYFTEHSIDDALHNISVKVIKTNKDAEGIFTTVEHYRKSDDTLVRKSVLSGGTSPQYTTRTITYYGKDGTTVVKEDIFTLSYDSDGVLISEV